MDGACSTNGKVQKSVQTLARKSDGKRLVGRLRHRWECKMITDLGEGNGWEGDEWIRLAQNRDQ
jgi:hypothetical protein